MSDSGLGASGRVEHEEVVARRSPLGRSTMERQGSPVGGITGYGIACVFKSLFSCASLDRMVNGACLVRTFDMKLMPHPGAPRASASRRSSRRRSSACSSSSPKGAASPAAEMSTALRIQVHLNSSTSSLHRHRPRTIGAFAARSCRSCSDSAHQTAVPRDITT